jgi:hypothetical protein
MSWANQTEIKSASSSRLYIVSELVTDGMPTGTWGCSCPGWKSYGRCKHLATMGLRSAREQTRPAPKGLGSGNNHAFSDDAYSHYDIRSGFGSPDEWIAMAEQHAYGRGRYVKPKRFVPSQAADLRLLNLTAMPADAKGLVRAMRKQALIDHPDIAGGDTERFKAMINAYERLLKNY